ncbi:MAG: SGNH/GDSL hydrolase family protein [Nitrospirae bacterium]|nr:SGNH/GDSL hydrolase family protein [Nitrospirota bacterium]
MRTWHHKLLAIFMGIIIFFIAGEGGYRTYLYISKPLYRPSNVPGLLWEPTPGADVIDNGVRYKINSNGLRDNEYSLEKPKNVIRIAVIGDSVTWGYTELQNTYPKVIERELKRLYPKMGFEVLNFGIEGTGSKHQLAIVTERVLKYSPNLVVQGHCLNDLLDDMRFAYIGPTTLWVLQHSFFADFITIKTITLARILRAKTGIINKDTYYMDSIKLYEEPERLLAFKVILKEMNKILRDKGVNFALTVFPFRQQLDNATYPTPQKRISDICRAEGVPFLDPIDALKEYNADGLYLKGDPVHFSSTGNKVVARSILNFLQSQGLLDYRELGQGK